DRRRARGPAGRVPSGRDGRVGTGRIAVMDSIGPGSRYPRDRSGRSPFGGFFRPTRGPCISLATKVLIWTFEKDMFVQNRQSDRAAAEIPIEPALAHIGGARMVGDSQRRGIGSSNQG